MTRPGVATVRALTALAALSLLAACGADDDAASESPDTTVPPTTAPEPEPDEEPADATDEGCGVTLAEVQALLPAGSGVNQNDTPDPRRCNFTWDDGGPRGIDVASVPGGRSAFDVPAGYEPIDGYGDEAFTSSGPGRASAVALVGDELRAVDVTADGSSDDLTDLCLQLLELSLA
jgi:hypothetical protein